MSRPFLIFSQSDYLIQVVDTNSNTEWQTVQIQISWLLQKPADLDLHCLKRQGVSGLSRTRVNNFGKCHNIVMEHQLSKTIEEKPKICSNKIFQKVQVTIEIAYVRTIFGREINFTVNI